jgi:flagellar motor switch protein FliM
VTSAPTASSARAASRPGRRSRGGAPQPYDFRRPIKLSREHIRTLQIAFETYARGCATLLNTRLRTVSQVTLLAIEQLSYEEYVNAVTSPTLIAPVTLDPLPGIALVEFSLGVAMASVDHMLGGPGGVQPQRPPTDLELPLLRNLIERMLTELQFGLEPLVVVRPRLGGLEYSPQFLRVFGPSHPVVVASFEMRIGAEACVATICMPFALILPALERKDADAELTPVEVAERRAVQANLTAGLEAVPLHVSVRFRPVRMGAVDVVDLQVGDVIPLNHPVTTPLAIMVNETTFAFAVPGNQGARLACLVVPQPVDEEYS